MRTPVGLLAQWQLFLVSSGDGNSRLISSSIRSLTSLLPPANVVATRCRPRRKRDFKDAVRRTSERTPRKEIVFWTSVSENVIRISCAESGQTNRFRKHPLNLPRSFIKISLAEAWIRKTEEASPQERIEVCFFFCFAFAGKRAKSSSGKKTLYTFCRLNILHALKTGS